MGNLDAALKILALANTLEPVVLKYILTLMEKAQGKTGDEFLSEADDIWAKVRANAQAELG